MTVVTELLALLKLDDSQFKTGMKGAKADAKDFGSKIKSAGNNIRDFGNKMTLATAPIALGLGIAINQARTFDKSMANVNAILGITGTEAEDLRAELLKYGGASRQGPQAVADAYYDIVSGVQDASTHMAILDAATRTADAGQADLTATTSALIGAMNAYGLGAEDASFVSDVFTNTVKMGKLSMDELASSMPAVTGLAATYGVSINDLGSAMSFMTTTGTSAAESSTFLKAMMTTLLNPTTSLATAINDLGYESGEAMLNTLGLSGSYEALKTYNNGTFAGLITNTEALQGATKLTGDEFTNFNEKFQETITGSTDAAKAIQDEEAGWDELASAMSAMSITVGSQLTPVLLALIEEAILPAITGVTDWMTANPELTRTLVMITGAVVVLGPAISALGTIVGAVTAIMSSAVAPILAIGAAVAGVTKAVNDFNNTTTGAIDYARSQTAGRIMSGEVSREQLDAAAFDAISSEFGKHVPFLGDLAARLTYSNFSDTLTPIEARATGGGVPAGSMMFSVNEDGMESWRSDSSGEVIPLGDQRGAGGATINVYQLPGEDGVALASRIQQEMMRTGMVRA